MAQQGAHNPEGDGGHNNQGLEVAAQGNGQQGEDGKEGQGKASHHTAHGVAALLLLALQVVAQAGVVGCKFAQDSAPQSGDGLFGVTLAGIDAGADIDHPFAVVAVDLGKTAPLLDMGRPDQGKLAAGGGANPHPLQIPDTAPQLFGIADHHLDLVAAPLQAQGLGPEEGGSDLAAQLLLVDPQAAGFGGQGQFEFSFALGEGVGNILHPGVAGQLYQQAVAGQQQGGEIIMGQLDVDIGPEADQVGGEGKGTNPGNLPGKLPPAGRHLGGGEFTDLGGLEKENNIGQVGAAYRRPAAGAAAGDGGADHRVDMAQNGGAVGPEGVKLGHRLQGLVGDKLLHPGGILHQGPLGQFQLHQNYIPLHLRHKTEFNHPAPDKARR